MQHPILGLHHVTATVDLAQDDLDFAAGALGLRLVKKTVNFDNRHVFHFYYGDEQGTPGTIWTTFPYHGRGVRTGVKGAGQVTATAFSVPAGSLDYWQTRLRERGIDVRPVEARFGEEALAATDPSGLAIELVGSAGDARPGWPGGVDDGRAVRGLHSVSLTVRAPQGTMEFLSNVFGFERADEAEGRIRMAARGAPAAGRSVDIVHREDVEQAANGLGTVHHVAFAISSEDEQRRLRSELIAMGFQVTEVMDRQYFRSIYFREPGGVLFEVATVAPGFAIDEALPCLGQDLKLPPWEEPNRAAIESGLPNIRVPRQAAG